MSDIHDPDNPRERSVILSLKTVVFLACWFIGYALAQMIGDIRVSSSLAISLPNLVSLFAIPAGLLLLQDCYYRNKPEGR